MRQIEGKSYLISARYGKTPWKELLLPSIELARNGFVVSEVLFSRLKVTWALDFRNLREKSSLIED